MLKEKNNLKQKHMDQEKTNKALSDLVIINNDRYEGYRKAMEETKDSSLKELFLSLSNQSNSFANELRKHFPSADQPASDETKTTGKVYRAWMDIKAAMAGSDRKAILESCEFGEDAALKEYDGVLEHPEYFGPEVLEVIRKQRNELQVKHDKIKGMRDLAKEKSYSW